MHRAALLRRQRAAVDQAQRSIELIGEIGRAPAIVGKRGDCRQSVLGAAHMPKAGFHSPNCQQRPRRHAVALLDRGEHGGIRLLERAPARYDGRRAPLGHELLKRQAEASLSAIGRYGCIRIVGAHQRGDAGGAHPMGARFAGERALPRLKTCRRIAALCGARLADHAEEGKKNCRRHYFQIAGFGHAEIPPVWRRRAMRTAAYRGPAFACGCRKRCPSPPAENQMRPTESQIGGGQALQRSGRRFVRAATRSAAKARTRDRPACRACLADSW